MLGLRDTAIIVLLIAVLTTGAMLLSRSYSRARALGNATRCKSNLKNIGTALEMYSTDNSGRFPGRLRYLSPNYLHAIPTCPAAEADTYSKRFFAIA